MQPVFIGPTRHLHFTSHNISLAKRPPLYYLCNSITRAERTFTAFRLSLGSKKGFNNQSLADFFLALNRNFPSLKKVSTHATAQGLLLQKLNFVQFNSFLLKIANQTNSPSQYLCPNHVATSTAAIQYPFHPYST